ncbi:MAG: hypothetical protein PHH82_00515 [Candidatus ainarchaeum sp.]|nr:hypothetical protein [Candidatus ainarchaeum sp.]
MKFISDKKGQISFEYLLTIVFAVLLVIAVTLFVLQLRKIGQVAQTKIENYKIEFFKKTFE